MKSIIFLILCCCLSFAVLAEEQYMLDIHVQYKQQDDSWKVSYELPIAVDHVAFRRRSNFDRRDVFKIDESKFRWDKSGEVLLIRSIDGSNFDSVTNI